MIIFSRNLLVLLIICSFGGVTYPQNVPNGPLERRIDIDIENEAFITVISILAAQKRLAIGIVSNQPEDLDGGKISIHRSYASVREILTEIERQFPKFDWTVEDEVITFTPKAGTVSSLRALLETRVGRYVANRNTNRFTLRNMIYDAPEVRSALKELGLTPLRDSVAYKMSIFENENRDIDLKNASLQNVLNKIVLEREYKCWILEVSSESHVLILSI